MIMSGNSLGDLADMLSTEYASVELQFRDAVKRIVRQNNLEWVRMYGLHKPRPANCRED